MLLFILEKGFIYFLFSMLFKRYKAFALIKRATGFDYPLSTGEIIIDIQIITGEQGGASPVPDTWGMGM